MCAGYNIPVGGFQQQSLIDYPGNIASVIFTKGCNLRCRYCHNVELVYPELVEKSANIDTISILNWIGKNNKLLDAIVVTGGEPTLHSSLPDFLYKIKTSGLKIKLDTNGTNPDMLQRLFNAKLVNYVAMDIKAPLTLYKYKLIAGKHITYNMLESIKDSIHLIQQSGLDFEFRTTLDVALDHKDIEKIIRDISGRYYLQKIHHNENPLHPDMKKFNFYKISKLIERTYPHIKISLRN
jgi:pyruvate formate lyase activating enzyme